jgi:NitT/TauT family transport system ATP-binding protein
MSLIQVNGLAKAFTSSDGETVEVLKSVSFEVAGPAVVGLLGPNGVGKSVTLRILAGLLEPESGSVKIDGKLPKECRIGFVPPSNPVFGWRRAIDDIAIGLEQSGVPRKERHEYVVDFMKRFSIDLPLHRRTHAFSSGQRQIANLARALVGPTPPEVVVLDEPWAALSPTVREELLRCLESVRQSLNVIVFLAGHSVLDAARACDWVIPLRERPVTVGQQDLIRVDLPHPRSSAVRTRPEFQELLKRFEAVYPTMAPVLA